MNVEWTRRAAKSFSKIKSQYFSARETEEYKLDLLLRIHSEIVRNGLLFKSQIYENTYYVRIDKYVISYEPSTDHSKYIITAFKHGRQNKAH